ncbi:hypothetical protein [Pelagicoccus mobilis]|uniref:Uncharacterized protein n=1 Tax=Pelagicoccus mobilis TaxID=415221 RepID=A0A934S752_9BACT|nr:hypothetical protein [Pelagicoccus mobilis]MBK1880599.1 hypothetical protein [Pelagicoccus mobilis]
MNPWIYILIGFLAFPVLAILFLLWVNGRNRVEPLVVRDTTILQEKIGLLYRNGKDKATLYLSEASSGFVIRIIKYGRKTKEDTIRVEIRATDKNEDGYSAVRDTLIDEGIEFEEKLTPKLKKPSRLFLKNEDGGIYTVSSVSQITSKLMKTLNPENQLDLLLSDRDPFFWKKKGTHT